MFPQIYDFRKTVGKEIGNKIENIYSIFTQQQKKKHSTSVCRVLFENILLIFVPRAVACNTSVFQRITGFEENL